MALRGRSISDAGLCRTVSGCQGLALRHCLSVVGANRVRAIVSSCGLCLASRRDTSRGGRTFRSCSGMRKLE